MGIFPTKILLVTDDSHDEQLARTTAVDMATATDSEFHVLCIASGLPPYEGYLDLGSTSTYPSSGIS
jgi:hypothetical protein